MVKDAIGGSSNGASDLTLVTSVAPPLLVDREHVVLARWDVLCVRS